MVRPVRMSMIAISVVFVLLTLQIPVEAKKKSSKRKKRAARSARVVVVVPPIFSPESSGDVFINNAAAPARAIAPAPSRVVAPSSPTKGGSMHLESAGGVKESKDVETIEKKSNVTREPVGTGTLMISEFRLEGPAGFEDEFIEIYNSSGADHTVAASSGTGYGIAASDGIVRCSIPNGTVIPSRGHYLCVNSDGYSLASYPSGNNGVSATTATGDATYTTEITNGEDPDGMGGNPPTPRQGIALFDNNSGGANFNLTNRFDAVGPTSEANTLYREGVGLPNLTPFTSEHSFVRDECGKSGSITTMGVCSISTPKDTDNNSADFFFVDTQGTSAGAGQRLGAPGPENLSSPIQRNSSITENLLDSTVLRSNPPNRVRDFTGDAANNSTFGTISIRRRFVNNTGAAITRLRFRIIDLTTFPAPTGFADLRARTSSAVVVAGINDSATCSPGTPPCNVTVQGTTLEQSDIVPPVQQPNGGGFNSSLSAGTVTLGTPVANGASVNLQFLFGIQQTGTFKVYVNIEALP
jgi:hypothetical protein